MNKYSLLCAVVAAWFAVSAKAEGSDRGVVPATKSVQATTDELPLALRVLSPSRPKILTLGQAERIRGEGFKNPAGNFYGYKPGGGFKNPAGKFKGYKPGR